MSDKPGLNEDEYLALVERIQRAMCLEPFQPDVTDVVVLIGTCQVLNREIQRLSRRLEWHEAMTREVERLNAENERLRAAAISLVPAQDVADDEQHAQHDSHGDRHL